MAPKKDVSQSYNNSIGLYHVESSQSEVVSEKATKGNLDTIDEYLTPTSGLRPTHGSHVASHITVANQKIATP
ncbi:hypothetical protein HYE68_000845 [Fusarium pseudograminearum]|nr:hypothetical protein HYE68_000845 [Fusarium pseudograminearum]